MTRKTIREVIESYMGKDAPEEVQAAFGRWLADREACDEKDEALGAVWDSMPLSVASAPEDPLAVLADAERIEDIESGVPAKKTVLLWITSAVAACMTVFAILGWSDLNKGDTCLASSETSKGSFVLPDGSRIWLNKGSRLYYSDRFGSRLRKVRLEGEGYFDVVKDGEHPFVVEAGGLAIKVLGTRFTVSAYQSGPVTAYLEEGSILAMASGHEDVTLMPDQAVRYDKADGSLKTFAENASDHTAWIDARLEFENKPLTDILDCLEHWYGIEILCNDRETASGIRLSMVIRQEPVGEILNAIGAIADFSYFIEADGDVKISFIK